MNGWRKVISLRIGKMREIVRDSRFEKEMSEIEPSVRRADEFLRGTEEILSKIPEEGNQLKNSMVWMMPGPLIDLVLYYTFDKNKVYFLSIKESPTYEF